MFMNDINSLVSLHIYDVFGKKKTKQKERNTCQKAGLRLGTRRGIRQRELRMQRELSTGCHTQGPTVKETGIWYVFQTKD